MFLTQVTIQICDDFLMLTYSLNFNILIEMTILMSTGGFFDIIIDVDC